ncbi:butyrate kinase [Pseudobutyrivibrio ruminis]|uniref:Probable butyrate kinase n=1 Tax=Pseudobutyrivibrio ruminis DSM 9787 TaxID=1123011 RepID=A0A285RWR3_9FIRM|nr:butyrate kinase [Pseudobutyrivibrio ruminis]SOB98492.1 butyrate kinase [Pseudobutyrivibrio ruminis DSM 9787]
MANEKILVINPGSTSTKIAVYQADEQQWVESIAHSMDDLKNYPTIYNQLDMRKELIMACLTKHGDKLDSLGAIVGRGGALPPVKTGAYEVNEKMVDTLRYHPVDQHASNLGAGIAYSLAQEIGVKAYIYDAITVDEMTEVNKITGLKGVRVPAKGHNLNTRAAALKLCADKGIDYNKVNIIVAHLGGGITVNLHSNGQIVDFFNDEIGTFAPERAGGLPTYALVDLCYSGEYTKEEMMKKLQRKGGIASYLGTADMREVEQMVVDGNEEASLLFEAMALNTAKTIARIAPSVDGKVDYIVLTGGLAYSDMFVDSIKKHVGFVGPIEVIPGENEMKALAEGTLRVMRGQEKARIYE